MAASSAHYQARVKAFGELLRLIQRDKVNTPLDLDDWIAYLTAGHYPLSPVCRWFIYAIQTEWLPPAPPTPLCAEMIEYVQSALFTYHSDQAPLWGHILRVTGCACWLAEQRHIDPEESFLAAVLHDLHKNDEAYGRGHEEMGAAHARRLLKDFLPPHSVERIANAIAIHPDRPPSSWLVACVLHDADKLDKIGAAGLLRRASAADDPLFICIALDRLIDDYEAFPIPCLTVTGPLLAQKAAFMETLLRYSDAVCDE